MKKPYQSLLFALITNTVLQAQPAFYSLTPLPLTDLSGFKNAGKNWEIVGGLSGGLNDTRPKAETGSGILYNNFEEKDQYKPVANLFTLLEHGDIVLSLDFLMPKGSNSGIYLQGRYEVQLFDSRGVVNPKTTDCGSIYERWDDSMPEGKKGYEGHPPRVNATFAPNLWQHLEIEFDAPRFDGAGKKIRSARFIRVALNGVVLHENVIVTGPTRSSMFKDEKASAPIMIQGDHGPVAFRNIQYAMLNEYRIETTGITYKYFEGKYNNFSEAVLAGKPTKEGKTEMIDLKVADNPNNLCLIFEGKLIIREASPYRFILRQIGMAKLTIDGEALIGPTESWEDQVASKSLSVGQHNFSLSYIKNFSWAPTGVGLYIGKQNSRPNPLHAYTSLPKLPPTPLIAVQPGHDPELIRSFMMYEGKKKTHVVSVGDPTGINYSYNLKQGAVLQCWKGEFLDVTEMWYERGEPQLAAAMGARIVLKDRCPLAFNTTPLPDSLNDETDLVYTGYTLNEKHLPQFRYKFKNVSYEDLLEPDPDSQGLTRTITLRTIPKGQEILVRLAEAQQISKVGENLFAIGDQSYYVFLKGSPRIKAEIKQFENKKELVVLLSETSVPVHYTLLW